MQSLFVWKVYKLQYTLYVVWKVDKLEYTLLIVWKVYKTIEAKVSQHSWDEENNTHQMTFFPPNC